MEGRIQRSVGGKKKGTPPTKALGSPSSASEGTFEQ